MKKITLFVLALIGLISCISEPDFSIIPEIGFNRVQVLTKQSADILGNTTKRDSVILTIDFKDGDGDLGLTQDDFQKLNMPDLRTFDVDIYVQKNGQFVKTQPSFPLGGNHFERYKPGDKPGPIEGTIDFSMNFDYNNFKGIPLLTGKKDTVRFDIWIIDRALHKSNVVQSVPLVLFAN
ncbi:hypothetical protein [Flectobacillus major]|jgi:hypothetical protein|uniref:hypothetical protein n=1 Tax=Flectobacillus major TaxID=103 RepID=UPI0004165443|nr:hypothetical protein [Flectobacillus major]